MHSNVKSFAYYFPGFSRSRPVDEWSIVVNALPKFPGHNQPRKPANQYYIEDDQAIIEAVNMAKAHNLNGFTFLWYWDNGKVEYDAALKTFCKHFGNDPDFSFNILWVNRKLHKSYPVEYPLHSSLYSPSTDRKVKTSVSDIARLTTYLEREYTQYSNYASMSGQPTLQIYDTGEFVRWTAELPEHEQAELQFLLSKWHLTATLPDMKFRPWMKKLAQYFKCTTSYVLLPNFSGLPIQCYLQSCANAQEFWLRVSGITSLQNIPSVTVGWDSTPRASQEKHSRLINPSAYPNGPIVVGSTPANFEQHLTAGIRFAIQHDLPLVNISSFNEWSEGHTLETDREYGNGYLEAVLHASDTFKTNNWRTK